MSYCRTLWLRVIVVVIVQDDMRQERSTFGKVMCLQKGQGSIFFYHTRQDEVLKAKWRQNHSNKILFLQKVCRNDATKLPFSGSQNMASAVHGVRGSNHA